MDIASIAINLIGVVLVALVLRSLVRRWRAATRAERRLYTPMYAAGVALMIALIGQLVLQSASSDSKATDVAFVISLIPFALVPYLFLGSLVRARLLEGGAVTRLMSRLNEAPRAGHLRDALADALEDPTLELVYWLPERQALRGLPRARLRAARPTTRDARSTSSRARANAWRRSSTTPSRRPSRMSRRWAPPPRSRS